MQNLKKNFSMIRVKNLNTKKLNSLFEIIKVNMTNLGFNVSDNDKEIWCNNIKHNLTNNNFYLFVVSFKGCVCGFVEAVIEKECLFVSEVQLNNFAKQTRTILYIIQSLLLYKEFLNKEEVYFSILKHNKMSNKTFSHLGGEIVGENEKKYKYKITRELVNKWLSKIK